jgi:hypothetical protein
MSRYRVVQPCIFVKDGAAIHHQEPGALIDLSDKQAAELGDAVESVSPARHKPKKAAAVKDWSLPAADCALGEDTDGE